MQNIVAYNFLWINFRCSDYAWSFLFWDAVRKGQMSGCDSRCGKMELISIHRGGIQSQTKVQNTFRLLFPLHWFDTAEHWICTGGRGSWFVVQRTDPGAGRLWGNVKAENKNCMITGQRSSWDSFKSKSQLTGNLPGGWREVRALQNFPALGCSGPWCILDDFVRLFPKPPGLNSGEWPVTCDLMTPIVCKECKLHRNAFKFGSSSRI